MSITIPRRMSWIWWMILAAFVAGIIAARLYLNVWAKDYVIRVLNDIPGYEGSIASINIDLYRGAYRIHQLKIEKKNAGIPTPFVNIDTVDFSMEWLALLHGRIVSKADLYRPVINFAVSPAGTSKQNGAGVDWTRPIKSLTPIDINLVTFREGMLSYRDFSTTPTVNIYIHHMSGELRNLRNVVDKEQKLPSTLTIAGDSIGGGALAMKGRLNILTPVPDMDIAAKLEKVDLKALSDYSNAYVGVDIRGGTLNVYSQFIVNDGRVSGYIKPIATDVQLIDLRKKPNPIRLAWETVVAVVVEIFTNQPYDQFATDIPLAGDLKDVHGNALDAIGGILRNAFIAAFKKGFDPTSGAATP